MNNTEQPKEVVISCDGSRKIVSLETILEQLNLTWKESQDVIKYGKENNILLETTYRRTPFSCYRTTDPDWSYYNLEEFNNTLNQYRSTYPINQVNNICQPTQ